MEGIAPRPADFTELGNAETSQRKGQFLVTQTPISEQISALQERHFARAAAILRAIKSAPSLRVSKVYWEELEFTRQSILDLENLRESYSRNSQEEVVLLTASLNRLKRERREQAQIIESLREQLLEVPEVTLAPVAKPELPAVTSATQNLPTPTYDIVDDLVVARIPGLKPINKPRRFILNTAALGVLAAAGYLGLTSITSPTTPNKVEGQVAGVSTTTSTTSGTTAAADAGAPEQEYPESFADVSFQNTIWDRTNDTDFGLAIDYPKNASNRVRIIGGDNMWFLRKSGFLMKISRVAPTQPLDEWWTTNQKDYVYDGDQPLKATLAGVDAWLVKPATVTDTSGDHYFVSRPTGVFHIWVKNANPTSDDGLRIERMLNSLSFNEPQP